MRSPSLSKSKSEVSGQSGHCSAQLLAALRANCGLMHRSKQRVAALPMRSEWQNLPALKIIQAG